jgi:septation ring formation regulator EzrA
VPNIIHENIINLDVDNINFEDKDALRGLIHQLLNIIEQLAQADQEHRREKQQLKDEINRLKGEKGKPKIRSNNPDYRLCAMFSVNLWPRIQTHLLLNHR